MSDAPPGTPTLLQFAVDLDDIGKLVLDHVPLGYESDKEYKPSALPLAAESEEESELLPLADDSDSEYGPEPAEDQAPLSKPHKYDGLKREDLVGLVLKQSDRWPKSAHGPFRRWKTNMDTMKNVLVGSAFTTTSPLPSTLSSTVETPPASDTVQNDASSLDNFRNVPVRLPTILDVSLTHGEFRVAAADVLAALQALISVIVGSAKIGVPDEHDAAYLQFFAVIANSKSPSPEAFGGRLLRDPTSSSSSVPPSGPLSGLLSFPESVPGEHSAVAFLPANPSLLSSSKRASSPVQFTEQQMTWLKRKAEASEGYEEFARHHNKQLSNLQRVEYWKFAADFSHRYYKAPWPADVPRSGSSKIQRPAIASALGMGLTALNQAINLARILDVFYFGAQRSEDVARMVEDKEQVGAADVLVDFLTGWAQSHPGTH
ncbi:hypothetical protein C8F01DRAFT_1254303 [Mycena amicta]|nr:hypothetical protein C8F01DRAFT_1254303 [Mycena amicta]